MKKKKVEYSKAPPGKYRIVPDFLPDPSRLVMRGKTVRVTLTLPEESVEKFKAFAEENNTKYQRVMRNLIAEYADHL